MVKLAKLLANDRRSGKQFWFLIQVV